MLGFDPILRLSRDRLEVMTHAHKRRDKAPKWLAKLFWRWLKPAQSIRWAEVSTISLDVVLRRGNVFLSVCLSPDAAPQRDNAERVCVPLCDPRAVDVVESCTTLAPTAETSPAVHAAIDALRRTRSLRTLRTATRRSLLRWLRERGVRRRDAERHCENSRNLEEFVKTLGPVYQGLGRDDGPRA